MAVDFVHTEELVDAVIAVLKGDDGATHTGGLPASWFGDAVANDPELVLLEHGDLADIASPDALLDLSPSILVRGLGPVPGTTGGVAGVQETMELIRVVHLRAYADCYDDSDALTRDFARSRARYAKIIGKALFNDPKRRLATIAADTTRTEVSLTSSDPVGAQLVQQQFVGWDLGYDIGNPYSKEDVRLIRQLRIPAWSIACDFTVMVRSGGQS